MTLRSARIQRGLTIEQVAQDTRISARFLEALENESFEELPAPVYVRGFLRSYGNYLRLDPAPLVAELPGVMGGGEAAVIGAAEPAREAPVRRSADPFRPAAPARPLVIGEDDFAPLPPPRGPAVPVADPFSPRRAETETPLDAGYESPYRRGRVGGVLVERGAVYEDNGRVARFAALVGGGLVVLALMAFAVMALGGGGDGDGGQADSGDENTPGAASTKNPIVVGGTATPGGSVTVEGSSTPDGDETATATPEGDETATSTTASETPTRTPTQVPPTATPVPPTPTPVPDPPTPTPTLPPSGHGIGFSECPQASGEPQCPAPMKVVCPPGEPWFVDLGEDFPLEGTGYRWGMASTNSEARIVGESGCV